MLQVEITSIVGSLPLIVFSPPLAHKFVEAGVGEG